MSDLADAILEAHRRRAGMLLNTRPAPIRLIVFGAALLLVAVAPACGGSGATGSAAPSSPDLAGSSSVVGPTSSAVRPSPTAERPSTAAASPSPSAVGRSPAAGTASSSGAASKPQSTAASPSGAAISATGGAAWQATGDESSAAATVVRRFVGAVDARDFTEAGNLMAPDAVFRLEDVTDDVAHMKLARSTLSIGPDGEGRAHLAMTGAGAVSIVAGSGGELESGSCRFTVGLHRDSRRDEWRVWDFELQQR